MITKALKYILRVGIPWNQLNDIKKILTEKDYRLKSEYTQSFFKDVNLLIFT